LEVKSTGNLLRN